MIHNKPYYKNDIWYDVDGNVIDTDGMFLSLNTGLDVDVSSGDVHMMLSDPAQYEYKAGHMVQLGKTNVTAPKELTQVHIAGVYHEDDNVSLGAFTSVELAQSVANSMVAHNDNLVPYHRTLEIDKIDLAKSRDLIDRVIKDKS